MLVTYSSPFSRTCKDPHAGVYVPSIGVPPPSPTSLLRDLVLLYGLALAFHPCVVVGSTTGYDLHGCVLYVASTAVITFTSQRERTTLVRGTPTFTAVFPRHRPHPSPLTCRGACGHLERRGRVHQVSFLTFREGVSLHVRVRDVFMRRVERGRHRRTLRMRATGRAPRSRASRAEVPDRATRGGALVSRVHTARVAPLPARCEAPVAVWRSD
jgi:hypothetical protein